LFIEVRLAQARGFDKGSWFKFWGGPLKVFLKGAGGTFAHKSFPRLKTGNARRAADLAAFMVKLA
jgi:hypothetical protein